MTWIAIQCPQCRKRYLAPYLAGARERDCPACHRRREAGALGFRIRRLVDDPAPFQPPGRPDASSGG